MLNYGYPFKNRDEVRHTAKRSGIPALSSPFRLRPTRDYHPSASSRAPKLSGHVHYALDGKTAAETSSDRASFPGKRERKRIGRRIRATGCDAFLLTTLCAFV